jgi:hypothetical protein
MDANYPRSANPQLRVEKRPELPLKAARERACSKIGPLQQFLDAKKTERNVADHGK